MSQFPENYKGSTTCPELLLCGCCGFKIQCKLRGGHCQDMQAVGQCPMGPKRMTLSEIVEQLKMCKYIYEIGHPIENNVAFVELEKRSRESGQRSAVPTEQGPPKPAMPPASEQDSEGELKPCPHCGGEAEELSEDRCSNVHCPECCGVVYGNSIEDARRKWNRREHAPTDQDSEDKGKELKFGDTIIHNLSGHRGKVVGGPDAVGWVDVKWDDGSYCSCGNDLITKIDTPPEDKGKDSEGERLLLENEIMCSCGDHITLKRIVKGSEHMIGECLGCNRWFDIKPWNEHAPTDQGQDIITCSAPAPENCEWSERIKGQGKAQEKELERNYPQWKMTCVICGVEYNYPEKPGEDEYCVCVCGKEISKIDGTVKFPDMKKASKEPWNWIHIGEYCKCGNEFEWVRGWESAICKKCGNTLAYPEKASKEPEEATEEKEGEE